MKAKTQQTKTVRSVWYEQETSPTHDLHRSTFVKTLKCMGNLSTNNFIFKAGVDKWALS